ncbi:XRE family transcriptional regulator [Martelella sp. AD-3]|uniref:helix-turn-helix domain-containing protein n=1 Tax=Martelella sp. AD-3 TaxID=686597 RepID=UPI000466BC5A|nr:XRE family transcriptional regulator [Martelella sp. AD-3]AMM84741.1 Cro/Cl family transcriptional regulator [Martelella sp. AD-3]MAM09720.1 XRE family transcriptional regulator [Rhizobiaceae bacterium]
MTEKKIFAGPRLRRIRKGLDLTQTAMAEALSISPSYLNLIERNQRPLTVQLLLKLAAVYDIDIGELQGESSGTISQLKSVFSDPLLSGELPGDQELVEVAEAAPNAAIGIIKLYRAYCEQAARLSDLSALLAHDGRETHLPGKRLPHEEVRDAISRRPYFFDSLDRAAEALHAELDPGDELSAALKTWLMQRRGITVRILPPHAMVNLGRRFDRHTMRLFISARFSPRDRKREIAIETVLLALADEIAAEVKALDLSSDEARRIARFELARYAALALMMPYGPFIEAARRDRFDIGLLSGRFDVSFEQAATRLASLQRLENAGPAFFAMEIDQAGNILRRIGAEGFPHAGFRGECPRLDLYDAFSQPGRIVSRHVEMPDGVGYLTLSRTLEGPEPALGERLHVTAILLGLRWDKASATAYAEDGGARAGPVPVGPVCRLCERPGCLSRAEPPVTRPLGLDEMVAGLSAFDFR